jgi:PPP family 3-phenylpropionic acid transporter
VSSHARIPHVPLASFYFFYFAVLGGFMPYWGLYLQQLSFSPEAIGQLMAILMATRIVAPNFGAMWRTEQVSVCRWCSWPLFC